MFTKGFTPEISSPFPTLRPTERFYWAIRAITGRIPYHLDTQGTLLQTCVLSDPENPDCSLAIVGASMVGDNLLMIATSYEPTGSVVALGLPDGTVKFIRRLHGFYRDAVALPDGLRVCGTGWSNSGAKKEEWSWAARINAAGDIAWEYNGERLDRTADPGADRYARLCGTFQDGYVVAQVFPLVVQKGVHASLFSKPGF